MESKQSFFEKKDQKTFICSLVQSGVREGRRKMSEQAQGKKFFASFFVTAQVVVFDQAA